MTSGKKYILFGLDGNTTGAQKPKKKTRMPLNSLVRELERTRHNEDTPYCLVYVPYCGNVNQVPQQQLGLQMLLAWGYMGCTMTQVGVHLEKMSDSSTSYSSAGPFNQTIKHKLTFQTRSNLSQTWNLICLRKYLPLASEIPQPNVLHERPFSRTLNRWKPKKKQ